MPNYFYTDASGQKQGPYSSGQLKELAKTGRITPETMIETEDGKKARAGKVQGLAFPETPPTAEKPVAAPGKTSSPTSDGVVPGVLEAVTARIEANKVRDADVHKKDIYGKTRLHKAVEANDTALAATLIAAGGDVNGQDNDGKAPLHYAAQKNSVGFVTILAKANVNLKDNAGATPLHYAVAVKAVEFIDALGKVGINVNAKNSAGLTPLHLASFFYYREVISTLVKAGADVNARDNEAMTPLHYATGALASGMSELLKADSVDSLIDAVAEIGVTISVLAAAGADVNAKSKEGVTPLHCAAATNNIPGHTALTASHCHGCRCQCAGQGWYASALCRSREQCIGG